MGNHHNNNSTREEFNKLKVEYFQLIQSDLQTSCLHNKTNKMNNGFSLNKIEFTQEKSCLQIKIPPNKEYVYWKDYFFLHLRKEAARNYHWATELFFALKKKDFSNEFNWLSLFFFQEYAIITKPKCLSSIQPWYSFDLSKIDQPNFQFESNYMGSFGSIKDNNDGQNENQALFEYNYYKHYIKQYIDIFQQHIFNPTHPINIVIKCFVKEFSQVMTHSCTRIKSEITKEEKEKILHSVIRQIQRFIVEIQITVKLFYSKAINYKYFIEEKDEFNNLVTALLFKTDNIYQLMFNLFEMTYEKDIYVFQTKLIQYKDISPEELGVAKQFRLDKSTKAYQIELIGLSQNEKIKGNNIHSLDYSGGEEDLQMINIDKTKQGVNKKRRKINDKIENNKTPLSLNEDPYTQNEPESYNKEIVVISESQKLERLTLNRKSNKAANIDFSNKRPFEEAIDLLKGFDSLQAPFEKIMAIATLSAEIISSVNNAWHNMINAIPESLLKIEADQLLNIYLYIIIKAQCPNLFVHLCFAQYFTSEKTKSFSSVGYYFNSFEGCIQYILNVKDIEKDNDKIKEEIIGSINN